MNKKEQKEYSHNYYLKNKKKIADYNSKWQKKNKQLKSIHNKRYRDSNMDKITAINKSWALENRKKTRNHQLKFKYGISQKQYATMFAEQDGKCCVCEKPEIVKNYQTNKINKLCVDHNHLTGKTRGLLCQKCNSAYGLLMESEENIISLLTYHRKHATVDEEK